MGALRCLWLEADREAEDFRSALSWMFFVLMLTSYKLLIGNLKDGLEELS
jgi:hypothetical protein